MITFLYIVFFTGSKCPHLQKPANGHVSISGRNQGDTATYSCNSEYEIIGKATMDCSSHGQWTEEPKICTSKCAGITYMFHCCRQHNMQVCIDFTSLQTTVISWGVATILMELLL